MSAYDPRISQIVREYSSLTTLDPILCDLFEDAEAARAITNAVRFEKDMIEMRSSDPNDRETTIYQEAFFELCQLDDSTPAWNLWVDQILGLNAANNDRAKNLRTAVTARTLIVECEGIQFNVLSSTSVAYLIIV